MTWRDRKARRAALRKNLTDHLELDANAELPESHDLRFARWLVFTLVSLIFVLLTWSAYVPVNEVASGRGVIQTETDIERLEHKTGGQIQSIHVRPGQIVQAGEPVVSFKTASLVREIEKNRASLAALRAERARLNYVLKGELPDTIPLARLSQNPEGLLFWSEQSYVEAQLDLFEAEQGAIQDSLELLANRKTNLKGELALLRRRFLRSRKGRDSGALSKNEVERQEREVLQAERSLLILQSEIASQKNASIEIELRSIELLAKRRREAALRVASVDSEIAATELTIAELRDMVATYDVRASVSGAIMSLGALRPNEVISAGELIAEIIPEDSSVNAEIEVPAAKIGNIRVGMDVRIKVDTFDFMRFGELMGTVAEISPTSRETEQGEIVYIVKVALQHENGPPMLDGKPLRPGMTVTGDILTESKTVLTYLLKPLRLLRDRAFTEA